MAKGKGVPINMRGEMQKRAQMEQVRQQMMGDDSDGLPVFNVFVRSKRAGIWYPAGTLKGDARSKSLVEAWRDNSLFLKDQYKSTLDKGMAKSLFESKDKFVESVIKMYPQLKNSRGELEFGYRVRIPGLEEKMKAEDLSSRREHDEGIP
ncbi:hypothetical protein GUITHDRAFT_117950 [Guillardia theta CCMP2712]|uniref:Uncharacterized protein n=1 Tax=Guillardia theta (strain CCMP2712) TaxID=905079 RepID=L1IIK2_GUITC|nr:hypothetical protein GUITHDRAFT_117950 [Guillardia theta CCMP2712]EKX35917.1 hypothetical protein GUITHDRAFT_117950 [Guillardia theta CCMP2712]|eukprot:XP_005822897.1 hypothetical protein GUITHDRAFT_117950 [Guillardia theta CCMP2712]